MRDLLNESSTASQSPLQRPFVGGAIAPSTPCDGSEVLFFFDAEDYTSDLPNDALRDLANLFAGEGFTVHVAIVGYLAHEITRRNRKDVVEAVSRHLIGTQSLYHSRHPTILELSDEPDYASAYEKVFAEEKEGCDLIEGAFGRRPFFAVPPGNCKSYVAMDVYADLGMEFYCDTVCHDDACTDLLYCNLRQFPYSTSLESLIPGNEPQGGIDWDAILDKIASRPRQLLYLHPCMAVNRQFWDGVNYRGGNLFEFGKWRLPERRTRQDTETYYARLRELLRRLRADGRFTFPTLADKRRAETGRVPLRRGDAQMLLDHMRVSIDAIPEPSWSVADVFQAAVKFLRGGEVHIPGKAYGFLEHPISITEPTTLRVRDLVEAARAMDVRRHLPARIGVGGRIIGPGDFLLASLATVCAEGDSVTVAPSDPLAALARFPALANFHPAGRWLLSPEFHDKYASDRLRLQVWTWRPTEHF